MTTESGSLCTRTKKLTAFLQLESAIHDCGAVRPSPEHPLLLQIALSGSGGILAGGRMPPSHLLINMTGSGNTLLSIGAGNTIQGTLLGPRVGANPLDGVFGSVILGQNVNLASGMILRFGGCVCP